MEFDDNDLTFHLVLAKELVKKLSTAKSGIEAEAEALAKSTLEELQLASESETVQKLNASSLRAGDKFKKLLHVLAVLDRVELLIARNKNRARFIEAKCKELGLIEANYDKAKLKAAQKVAADDLIEENLHLNPSKLQKTKQTINGELLSIAKDRLDFADGETFEKVLQMSAEDLTKLIKIFPKSAGSVPVERLLNSKFRDNLLKAIATYAIDEFKRLGLIEINKNLGSLLSFRIQIPTSIEGYMVAVSNLYSVRCKEFLLKNFSTLKEEILNNFECNEKSEFIFSGSVDLSCFESGADADAEENSSEGVMDEELSDFISDLFG